MEEYIARKRFRLSTGCRVNIPFERAKQFLFAYAIKRELVAFSPVNGYDGFTTLHLLREGYVYRVLNIYICT